MLDHKLGEKLGQNGFSTSELLVVLAIMAILTIRAVPQFSKMSNKSRQSEVKSQLGALFQAEKTYYIENQLYYHVFQNIGYAPMGTMVYNIGFENTGAFFAQPQSDPTSFPTSSTKTTEWCLDSGQCTCNTCPTVIPGSSIVRTPAQFTAGATATLNASAGNDTWTINEIGQLLNTNDGR